MEFGASYTRSLTVGQAHEYTLYVFYGILLLNFDIKTYQTLWISWHNFVRKNSVECSYLTLFPWQHNALAGPQNEIPTSIT